MANTLKIKRSAVEGKIPLTTDLELGEIAVNTYDGKLFLKRNDGLQDYIVEVGGNQGFEVKNQTGSAIPKGAVVGFAGTLGSSGKLLCAPFLADGTQPSDYVMGVVLDTIPNGGDGFVVDHGKIYGVNTSVWPEGTVLYASTGTAGALVSTRPQAPNNKITVAAVVNSHATEGVLEVRVTLGSRLDNDELVELGTLANGDVLRYNATTARFENTTHGYVQGDVVSTASLKSVYSAGDEGGEIFLAKPQTNTAIVSGVRIDVYQNKLRFWEDGGTNRGFYLDITAGSTAVGSNLAAGGATYTAGDGLTLTGSTFAVNSTVLRTTGNQSIAGIKTFTNNTASTSTTTGSIVVTGGVGISGSVNIGGDLLATSKSFLINHPTKEGKKLRYGSLEGPEHGVYVRGKIKGTVIELPEYWTKLVDPNSITVQLTAIGTGQKLYVKDICNNIVHIENDAMFVAEPHCFYLIHAERIDVAKMEVEIG